MERKRQKSTDVKGKQRPNWVFEAVNFINENIPAFQDIFDKVS